jgi:hypothetical protein
MFKCICNLCISVFSSHFKSFSCIIVMRIEHVIPHLHFYLFFTTATSKLVCVCVFSALQNLDYVVSNDRVTDAMESIWKETVMVELGY